ncbi:MAG: hypothetical protein E6K22_13410 [Gammaproteobacteria bacterium]|nr:MAG: hypothetical protein E6K22_13410 [Gammaproteobacteria bacterium]TLZ60263.1 MAG: hypothetical protein E6K20_13070 [Gammaproteobacteria bacterium]
MIDAELEKVIGKTLKLKELHRARARVLQLERELRGEATKPEEPPYIPEFLVQQPARPAVRPSLSVVDVTPKAAA